ncbi:hypothetical protein TARUN_4762 [Trichoderma arundinaceum]|uniref:NB-ARC domain-containing protein n=1 Tax=Trichoderma arundinaceum TaxID=490622 RepID=A0A395NN83_TRIAR|nr:hypothetical protein TARUN_4762 [Trichoderma arundinaceum]
MQGIMLLALRMMSLDVAPDMPSDGEVLYGSTDYDLSRDNSNQYCEKEDEIGDGLSTQEEDSMGLDDPLLEDRVPDCGHYIDWQDTVLNNQPVAKADPFLQGIIDSGAFRTKPIENRLRPGTIILFPYRHDPDFVGRESLLHNLTRQCSAPPSRVAIVGLGGMGKSWLAIELAYQIVRLAKSSVFWIHADTLARVEEGFRKIATQVRPSSRNLSNSDLVQLAYNWLSDERNGRWVMILDGADEEEILRRGYDDSPERESLAAYLPQSPNGSIIITTRNRSIGSWLTRNRQDVVEVGPMAVSEALFLLEKKLGQLPNRDAATSLVRSIGLIPLAITQAAAYMQSLPQSWPNKHLHDLQDSQEEKLKLLDFEIGGLHRDADAPNSIFATWKKSFDSVRLRRPSAANLMSLMSFFDRRGIPKRLIKPFKRDDDAPWKYGPSKKEDQAPGSGDFDSDTNADSIFNDDIEMLINNHLVKANGKRDIFEMHGLVQLSVRKDLDVLMKQAFEQQFVKRLAAEFPTSTYSNWETCEELLAHVQVAASYQPSHHVLAEWATLLYNGGRYARLQGNYEVAKQMANKSIQGRQEEAERLHIQAMQARTETLGPTHPRTLTSTANMASMFRAQGQWAKAELLHGRVTTWRKKRLGMHHPHTLTSMSNLASMYRLLGRLDEADSLQVNALKHRKLRFGADHPETLTSMNCLASIYRTQGRLEEAERLQVQVMEVRTTKLGKDHPNTLASMNNLALIYNDQEKHYEAGYLQSKVVEICKTKFGSDHPHTLTSLNNLAIIWKCLDRHTEAMALMKNCVEARQRVLGPDHPYTLSSKVLANRWTEEMVFP